MKTKVIIVEANTASEFMELINQINDNHNVFATQTHITPFVAEGSSNGRLYSAVLFTRP